jgi:hypothetical protein
MSSAGPAPDVTDSQLTLSEPVVVLNVHLENIPDTRAIPQSCCNVDATCIARQTLMAARTSGMQRPDPAPGADEQRQSRTSDRYEAQHYNEMPPLPSSSK